MNCGIPEDVLISVVDGLHVSGAIADKCSDGFLDEDLEKIRLTCGPLYKDVRLDELKVHCINIRKRSKDSGLPRFKSYGNNRKSPKPWKRRALQAQAFLERATLHVARAKAGEIEESCSATLLHLTREVRNAIDAIEGRYDD